MKIVQGLIGLLVFATLSTSCVRLNGQLDIKQAMSAKKKSGFLNRKTKEIKIQPDLYAAELKVNGSKNFTLKLEGHENVLIPLKSEKNLNVPSNGIVEISHNDINQPFDIKGNIKTDVSHSGVIDSFEDCTRTVTENRCTKICEMSESGCRIDCKDEVSEIQGRRHVAFHFRTTQRDLFINFFKIEKPEVLATFTGTDTQVDRVVDFEGLCQ